MIDLLAIWIVLAAGLVTLVVGRSREGGALTLSYFLGLSLIHVPGVLVFLDPSSDSVERDLTGLGFELTVLGMGAFVGGALLARIVDRRRRFGTTGGQFEAFGQLGWKIIAVGVLAYFVLLPLSSRVPSLTAVVASMATVLILGLWLLLYGAVVAGNQRRTLLTLALLPMLPLATLVTGGFLGYGVYWVLSVVAFLFVIVKDRTVFYLSAPVVAYLGLSLFVTYMGQRNAIRELVWYENSSLLDRVERVSHLVTDFEYLNLDNPAHASALNGRLNQNLLVGAAAVRHETGASEFAFGATVPLWALIPRAVWPDKPDVGGSGSIVSDFTGISFAAGTSVGVGQVLEFYINFGALGVVLGFAAFGFLLKRLDRGIMLALGSRDARGLFMRAMPGLTLLQPGGSLLEMLVAFVGATVAAHLLLSLRLFRMPVATVPSIVPTI